MQKHVCTIRYVSCWKHTWNIFCSALATALADGNPKDTTDHLYQKDINDAFIIYFSLIRTKQTLQKCRDTICCVLPRVIYHTHLVTNFRTSSWYYAILALPIAFNITCARFSSRLELFKHIFGKIKFISLKHLRKNLFLFFIGARSCLFYVIF